MPLVVGRLPCWRSQNNPWRLGTRPGIEKTSLVRPGNTAQPVSMATTPPPSRSLRIIHFPLLSYPGLTAGRTRETSQCLALENPVIGDCREDERHNRIGPP
ncbi:MAG: hypothetical protein WBJ52_00975 [Methanoregulaceae archaeon]|nr:MAG: hypothetical protein IPI71_00400 [Methanolinea sp.]